MSNLAVSPPTHYPHCNDQCVHYLTGESVSGELVPEPDVPQRSRRVVSGLDAVTDSPVDYFEDEQLIWDAGFAAGRAALSLPTTPPLDVERLRAAIRIEGFGPDLIWDAVIDNIAARYAALAIPTPEDNA